MTHPTAFVEYVAPMTVDLPVRSTTERLLRQTRVFSARALSTDLVARWDALQRGNPTLASPYFRPEFTQVVAEVRDDVEVAVIEEGGVPQAFFPYQRGRFGAAQPVVGRLSDFHGYIAAPGFELDPRELLRKCGLRSWRFDHLIPEQDCFMPFVYEQSSSPYLDLSRGFAHYEADRNAANSELGTTKRKLGKLAREVGPLRLEWNYRNTEDLRTVQRWKSEQYTRTGIADLFTFPWIRSFFDRLLLREEDSLAGQFCGLYAGDRLVAGHLGMSSHNIMHWWFPAYDREYGRYSPGMALIYLMSQQANEHGITRIDLGKGDEGYKFRIASQVDQVSEGCVDVLRTTMMLRRSWRTAREWVRNSPLDSTARMPFRLFRRLRDWFKFQ